MIKEGTQKVTANCILFLRLPQLTEESGFCGGKFAFLANFVGTCNIVGRDTARICFG